MRFKSGCVSCGIASFAELTSLYALSVALRTKVMSSIGLPTSPPLVAGASTVFIWFACTSVAMRGTREALPAATDSTGTREADVVEASGIGCAGPTAERLMAQAGAMADAAMMPAVRIRARFMGPPHIEVGRPAG